MVVPAAIDGLFCRWHLGVDLDCRRVFRQGLSQPFGGFPSGARLLDRPALGAQDAARSPRRPNLAAKGSAGLARRLADRGVAADHVRIGGPYRGHAGRDERRGVVRARGAARAHRLCGAGRRRRRDDGGGGSCGRWRRASFPRGGVQGDAHYDANPGPFRHHQRRRRGRQPQHLHVLGCRDSRAGGQGADLRPNLPARACDPRDLG